MAYIRCRHCGKFFEENKECCPECRFPTELSDSFGAEHLEDESDVKLRGGFIATEW